MKSISFPNIFGTNKVSVNLLTDHAATYTNLALMLQSQKTALLGDPEFGTNLQKAIYEQNNIVLKDLIIDDIYTAIGTLMPQLEVAREDIEVYQDKTYLSAKIKAINRLDHTNNLYEVRLMELGELE